MCAIKGNIPQNNQTVHFREATCAGYGRQVDIDIAISVIQMISFGREASLNQKGSSKTYNTIQLQSRQLSGSKFSSSKLALTQVFDLYQLKKQTKAAPLTTQEIVFTKLDPTEGVKVGFQKESSTRLTHLLGTQVLKTRGKAEQIVTPELLGTAKDVVAKADGLVIQPKENPDKSSEDATETE